MSRKSLLIGLGVLVLILGGGVLLASLNCSSRCLPPSYKSLQTLNQLSASTPDGGTLNTYWFQGMSFSVPWESKVTRIRSGETSFAVNFEDAHTVAVVTATEDIVRFNLCPTPEISTFGNQDLHGVYCVLEPSHTWILVEVPAKDDYYEIFLSNTTIEETAFIIQSIQQEVLK